MGKIKQERDYRTGCILRAPTAITAPESLKSKAKGLKFTENKNLLQWVGLMRKCNVGKLAKLQKDGREEAQECGLLFVTKRH